MRRWAMATLGAGLYFSFTFAWNALPALVPTVAADLGLSPVATGVLLGTVAAVIFLTWPVMGPLVDRVGPQRAMGVGVVVLGVAAAARALADSGVALVAAMAVLSLGGSAVTYGLPRSVASWFPTEEAGAPLGVVTVGALLGPVTAFATMQTIAAVVGGWRPAFVAAAFPALILGSVWLAVGDTGPYEEATAPPSFRGVVELLRDPTVAIVVAGGVAYLFATHSVYGWLSSLLVGRGVGERTATHLVAVLTAGQVGGALGVPLLSDRLGDRAPLVGLSGVAFVLAIGAFSTLPPTPAMLTAVSVVAGVALGGISPLLRVLPVERVPRGTVSTVVGMVFGLGALGGVVGPVLVGVAVERNLGLGFAVLTLPGVALLGVAVGLRATAQPSAGTATEASSARRET